jgi:hypothetical protein
MVKKKSYRNEDARDYVCGLMPFAELSRDNDKPAINIGGGGFRASGHETPQRPRPLIRPRELRGSHLAREEGSTGRVEIAVCSLSCVWCLILSAPA